MFLNVILQHRSVELSLNGFTFTCNEMAEVALSLMRFHVFDTSAGKHKLGNVYLCVRQKESLVIRNHLFIMLATEL